MDAYGSSHRLCPTDSKEYFMWANDYPHQEGAWPHSAQAVERQMGNLTEEERADILGLNAARLFKFKVPDRYHKT